MPHIVPLYAALLAFLFFALAIRTITLRHRFRVAVGDGDQPLLRRAMRAHANCAEYVPICLLLLLFLEMQGSGPILLNILCGALVVGRCGHAVALSSDPEPRYLRPIGMALTFGPMLAAAAMLLLGGRAG